MMPTFAITQKKFTRTIRLELDKVWLTKPISMDTPKFKLDGMNDFECWITCKTAVTSFGLGEPFVLFPPRFTVFNLAMEGSNEYQDHLSHQVSIETSGEARKWNPDCISNCDLLRHNCIINEKVTFLITVTYAPPHFINNDVSSCELQLLPHEIMQFDEQSCDLKIVVGNLHLWVHKAFFKLVSPVFAAMFAHNTKEAQTATIRIKDYDYATVKTAIDLLYGRPFKPNSIQEVIAVTRFAEKYMIKTAVERLETWLTGNITIDNFGAIVEYALTHSSHKLKRRCASFYREHTYTDFPHVDPAIALEMTQLLY
uniref:BTB domain-containing protein n=1 Tax=Panagrellus redivivus TaxID=6233 RepID=A0A7E5A165_PANRE